MNEHLKKIPIENDELTPDMELLRSGSTMLFRKNYGDRQFIREENADVIIKAPRPELAAELIEGKWFWFNDCPDCNGNDKEWAYVKCEKHDICVTCNKKRREIDGTVWGHRKGFRCDPCQTAISKEEKRKALQKVAEKEYDPYDYQYTEKIICPHCGTESPHEMCDGEPDGKETCETCGGIFSVETHYTVEFSTEVIGDRVTIDSEET